MLFLCAQDLQSIWLGLIEDTEFIRLEERAVPPEGYLNALDHFFKDIRFSDLKGVSFVTGPGSFTSSRIILTIANTLHFVHSLPLYTLENPEHLHPMELVKQKGIGNPINHADFAYATYDRPPHITRPFGDK